MFKSFFLLLFISFFIFNNQGYSQELNQETQFIINKIDAKILILEGVHTDLNIEEASLLQLKEELSNVIFDDKIEVIKNKRIILNEEIHLLKEKRKTYE
tara:strand:- start:50 stop:346 length:297 start_codon:yes stop_codon:yes gene_type:complete